MKGCIMEIKDEDFGLESVEFNNPRKRFGARGIVIKDNEIAVFNKQLKNEYKLPGGGIDENEDPKEAFKREVLEETGCEVEIIADMGTIIELKSHDNFIQTSYLFIGKVLKDTGKLNLTQKETDEGARLLWCTPEEAYKLIKNSANNLKASAYEDLYHSRFIVKRDTEILKYYLENYK